MHELGIINQVIKTVNNVMAEQKLTQLHSITLEIGEMSDVVPKYLEEAWLAIKETTPYPKAELEVEIITARAKCKACGYTDLVKNFDLTCPECDSPNLEIISGREFNIKQITAK